MSAPQHEGRSIDLSGSRWREARARTAIPNPVASHGLNPRSGQLAGPGDDPLDLTILCPQPHARAAFPAPAAIGERGPLLAVLDWAQRRGENIPGAGRAIPERRGSAHCAPGISADHRRCPRRVHDQRRDSLGFVSQRPSRSSFDTASEAFIHLSSASRASAARVVNRSRATRNWWPESCPHAAARYRAAPRHQLTSHSHVGTPTVRVCGCWWLRTRSGWRACCAAG